MIDAVNMGAKQLAEALVNQTGQAGEGAGQGAGSAQVDTGDQARFQQAMGGAGQADGGSGVAANSAVGGPADAGTANPVNGTNPVAGTDAANPAQSPGESILSSLDKMRSGMTDATAGIQQGAASGTMLSQQELMQAQMSMVRFSTTETVYSKVAGTAKSGLDKLLGS